MAGNYVECPICGFQTGTVAGRALAGKVGEAKCEGCIALDRKPRTPLTYAAALAWAAKRVDEGYVVYIRPYPAGRPVQFNRIFHPAKITPANPAQLVVVCANK